MFLLHKIILLMKDILIFLYRVDTLIKLVRKIYKKYLTY